MLIELDYQRTVKRELEDRGDAGSEFYRDTVKDIKILEAEIGDYDGKA